ncbi:hypothetical protein CP967_13455 [Streptomyces nitrosporeus]|uniref:Lipoprotein n=1 Tax=Streptomyces nitrosporeus TaxID=28894 RepID=A0A5J6FA10_9ACTN|nr:hypothetical protein [Streptomyces nitrosporeus]QEU72876.1 hypothetical protein CP967_13455 [Streptomyces nitrosporeus]GGZ13264.1 hypothetical protein GCM10010327_50240 [Streptomyces nitrosporeus]
MGRTSVRVSAVVLAVTGALAGCTTGTGGGGDRPGGPSRQNDAVAAAGTPVDRGRELTGAERVLVERAEQMLVKECMAAEGFRYWVGPLPTADDLEGGGYVLTDAGWAKRHGYGSRLRERAQEAQRTDRNHAYVNGLTGGERARYGTVLEGTPAGGTVTAPLPGGGSVRTPRESCLAEAGRQLYGDFETWFRAEKTAMNLTPLYVPALVADERFVRAVQDWSACMRKKGHDYASPAEIREERAASAAGAAEAEPGAAEAEPGAAEAEAYAAEVELAVAEATCAGATPLAATARALQTEYRDEKLQPYAEDIAAYRRMSLAALARAEKITGSTA